MSAPPDLPRENAAAEPPPGPTNHVPGLDALRSLAILTVIGHHLLDGFVPRDGPRWLVAPLVWGNSGVDLFFVLSGYLIARLILSEVRRTGRLGLRRFWYRRWMRTLPAYYVTLAVIALSDWVVPPDRPWRNFWSYLVFLQNYANLSSEMRFPWSWSLCVEEWFYVFLPVLLLLLRWAAPRASAEWVLRAVALTAFAVSVAARHPVYLQAEAGLVDADHGYWRVYLATHTRLDGLAVGVLVATLRPRPSRWLLAGGLVAAAALAVLVSAERVPVWVGFQKFAILAVIFGMFVSVAVAYRHWRCWRVPGAAAVAALSYSLYLTHPIATKLTVKLLAGAAVGWRLAFFMGVTVAASLALRYVVERPFLWLRDRSAAAGRAG
jgi:peptidoglycan/LPS O-acetylase OafA/YrhL